MTAFAAPAGYDVRAPRRSGRFWRFVAASVGVHLLLVALFVALSLEQPDRPPPPQPMDVTIADDVGLKAAAPQNVTPPAQSQAPVIDQPEESPPPTPAEAPADPTPPKPQPKTAPPPKPAEVPKPQPRKAAPPAPRKVEKAQPKPAPAAPAKASKTPARTAGKGNTAEARRPRAAGASLGDIMKGISPEKSTSQSRVSKAATMSQQAMMDIGQKIKQQIQPCAARQSLTAPGVSRMRVLVNLRLNRDGSQAAPPRVVRVEGVDGENGRYEDQVRDRALAAFQDRRCQPLRGLPVDLYDVPNGWSSFTLRFTLPG